MPGTIVDKERNSQKIKALLDSDPSLKEVADEFEKEYEVRKKLALAKRALKSVKATA